MFLLSLVDGFSLCSCNASLCNCKSFFVQLQVSAKTSLVCLFFCFFFCFQSEALSLPICCVLELRHAMCCLLEPKTLMRGVPHCFYGCHCFCRGFHVFDGFGWILSGLMWFVFPHCSWIFKLIWWIFDGSHRFFFQRFIDFRWCWEILACLKWLFPPDSLMLPVSASLAMCSWILAWLSNQLLRIHVAHNSTCSHLDCIYIYIHLYVSICIYIYIQ